MNRAGTSLRTVLVLIVTAAISAVVVPLGGCSRPYAPQLNPASRLVSSGRVMDLMPSPRSFAPKTAAAPQGNAGEGVVSPDGEWLATVSGRGADRVFAVTQRNGTLTALRLRGNAAPLLPAWAPAGARLAFVRRQPGRAAAWEVCVFAPSAKRLVVIAGAAGTEPPAVSWFPDGRRVAYGNGNWLTVANAETRTIRAVAVPDRGRVTGSPAISPDGKYVVFAVGDAGVWILSVADGRMARVTDDGDVDGLAWAPGGREIAVRTSSDGRWRVRVLRALDFGIEDPKPER